ncbi:hypothetical protein GPECTOR_9g427 [Gonium pectorale]|uniref:Uncharacterized protein n=1 Tax=Gonium pectorale TaxID=33097 RepID=A0A150GRH0_GONPE|nr:hypothetical protein GPECTOR_9g427 [Gonium pectorale]|eukprot:KXZ52383.1 hypothetical protein GPECTOR_9g427 [Gonium pectorale]
MRLRTAAASATAAVPGGGHGIGISGGAAAAGSGSSGSGSGAPRAMAGGSASAAPAAAAVAGGAAGAPSRSAGADGDGAGGLVRWELTDAGELVTPALVAQVCSLLPSLRVLDVSRAFSRARARFQLGGDLLLRDLAVLAPQLERIVMHDIAVHGAGLPDERDAPLLPFLQPEQPLPPEKEGAGVDERAAAGGAARASTSSGGASAGGGGGSAAAAPSPFPRLRSMVIAGGSPFMKSRLRSLAQLRALRELTIEGMAERDFLSSCKMGCFEPLSALSALSALHVLGAPRGQQQPAQLEAGQQEMRAEAMAEAEAAETVLAAADAEAAEAGAASAGAAGRAGGGGQRQQPSHRRRPGVA